MAHGGYGKRRVAGRPPSSGGASNGGRKGRDKGGPHAIKKENEKKAKIVSIKNQIRSIERLLKKPLLSEVKDAQEKRLEDLKKQAELHARCELERKMSLRYRRVKFFERRKIERRIRRLEKQQRSAGEQNEAAENSNALQQQLVRLKEDLEYVRFFPKTEKYVSLFMGNDDEAVKEKRRDLRAKIKANLAAAIAAGVDLEETASEDDAVDMSEDDFFMAGSSSDDADADDELTDKSPRLGEEKDDMSKEVILTPQIPVHMRQKSWRGVDGSSKMALPHSKDQKEKSARALKSQSARLKTKQHIPGKSPVRNFASGSSRKVVSKSKGHLSRNPRVQPSNNENARPRSLSGSSHSSEIVKGSTTSDAPQQPRKRKRVRSKKKK